MSDASSVCSNPECQVAQLGTCHLDHDPIDSCPHYESHEPADLDPGEIEELPSTVKRTMDGIELRSNKVIPESGITKFRNRVRAKTIVLVGEQKTGKTTLLSALYGMFCKGPVGEFEFVGSQTLYSFAERKHLALFDPERSVPATPRTSRGDDVNFFHIRMKAGDNLSEIVISDRSGEAFEDARLDTALVAKLSELALADRVCFLLDAARLTRKETRPRYSRVFKEAIRSLLNNDAVPKSAVLEVLVTKFDRISDDPNGLYPLHALEQYERELCDEFGSSDYEFAIHRICALPRAKVKVGFLGMEELVARWAALPNSSDISPLGIDDALRHIDRLPKLWN